MTNSTKDEAVCSRRIAYNSLFLFLRFAFLMLLNLYSVRYVLQGLGEVDYGIYSAVASVVLTGACLTPVLSLSMQRYLSYALGRHDSQSYTDIFTASINVVMLLIVVLAVLFETFGLYFFHYLTIPAERLDAAMCVFQCSMLSFFFALFQIPFMAAIFSHEEMGTYSLISAAECVLKFLVAMYIVKAGMDGLVYYSGALLVVSVVVWLWYVGVATHRYSECRYRVRGVQLSIYRELLAFSGWTFYGAVASMGMIQGGAILLNMFFGPVMNAAFGIAVTVHNAFNAVTNSIVLAFRPAMIKSYAEKRYDALNKAFSVGNQAIMLLMLALTVPLIYEMPYVLRIWLGDCPETTVLFCRLMILYVVILAMNNPITTIVHAQGSIRRYALMVESLTILNVPVAFVVFELGAPPHAIFYVMVSLMLMAHVVRIYCLRKLYDRFSLKDYVRTVCVRGGIAAMLCLVLSYLPHIFMDEGFARLACVTAATAAVLLVFAWIIKKDYNVAGL